MDKFFIQLSSCVDMIESGSTSDIDGLNKFCAVFHNFASKFKKSLPEMAPKSEVEGNVKIHVETIHLCFAQIVTCITQLERTMSAERRFGQGEEFKMTRHYFLDRINWCLRLMQASLYQLSEESYASTEVRLEDRSFVELLDMALDKLEVCIEITPNESLVSLEDHEELYTEVNHIVKHALAFANVALEADKKALNTICETVLDECGVFEKNFDNHTPGERKLEALSLKRALFSLENYLNEALLRLIFQSFLDMEDTSISRFKAILGVSQPSPELDKLIADFDLNMDRIQQIGVFAIAFTADVKTKTVVRSCLASFESLDSCIVKAFKHQTSNPATQHAGILERHLKQELVIFRNVIHEIIDSRALISCYLDILGENIDYAVKINSKSHMYPISEMGNVLIQQFHLQMNYEELGKKGQHIYEDFEIILCECQAILEVSEHVDFKRIVKRFKILYSVLSKLSDAIEIRAGEDTFNCMDKSQTRSKNVSKYQRSYVKSKCNNTRKTNECVALEPLTSGSDLMSFQLPEIGVID